MIDMLLIPVALMTGFFGVQILMMGRRGRHYGTMLLLNCVVAIYALSMGQEASGAVAAIAVGAAFLQLLLPLFLRNAVTNLLSKQRFDLAVTMCKVREFLQPGMGGREQAAYIRQLQLADQGDVESIIEKIEIMRESTHDPQVRAALDYRVVATYAAGRHWQEAVDKYQQLELSEPTPELVPLVVRSYCELGQVTDAVSMLHEAHDTEWASEPYYMPALQLATLFVMAFLGRKEAVTRLITSHRGHDFGKADREFWIGLAAFHRGQSEEGKRRLETAARLSRGRTRERVKQRLADFGGEIELPLLGPEQEEFIADVEKDLLEQPEPAPVHGALASRRIIPGVLVLTSVLAWALTGWQASVSSLLLAGANYAEGVMLGEYWRLVTALFLHGNWLHLIFNAVGLVVLGKLIEPVIGSWRLVLLLLVCGVVGNALSVATGTVGVSVGASGALFGLVGVAAVVLVQRWQQFPPPIRLWFAIVVVAEVSLGFFYPAIDQSAHLGGFACGIAIALIPWSLRVSARWAAIASAVILLYGGVGRLGWSLDDTVRSAGTVTYESDGLVADLPALWAPGKTEAFPLAEVELKLLELKGASASLGSRVQALEAFIAQGKQELEKTQPGGVISELPAYQDWRGVRAIYPPKNSSEALVRQLWLSIPDDEESAWVVEVWGREKLIDGQSQAIHRMLSSVHD